MTGRVDQLLQRGQRGIGGSGEDKTHPHSLGKRRLLLPDVQRIDLDPYRMVRSAGTEHPGRVL